MCPLLTFCLDICIDKTPSRAPYSKVQNMVHTRSCTRVCLPMLRMAAITSRGVDPAPRRRTLKLRPRRPMGNRVCPVNSSSGARRKRRNSLESCHRLRWSLRLDTWIVFLALEASMLRVNWSVPFLFFRVVIYIWCLWSCPFAPTSNLKVCHLSVLLFDALFYKKYLS